MAICTPAAMGTPEIAQKAVGTYYTLKLEPMALVITRVDDSLVVFGTATMSKGAVYETYAVLYELTMSMDSCSKVLGITRKAPYFKDMWVKPVSKPVIQILQHHNEHLAIRAWMPTPQELRALTPCVGIREPPKETHERLHRGEAAPVRRVPHAICAARGAISQA